MTGSDIGAGCASILIVEDEADIRDALKDLLEDAHYQVFTASNGRQGLELLPRMPTPCLILLDLMMPVMNGWEFLEARRAADVIATIPVVIVSAYVDPGNPPPGAAAILKKPVDLDALLGIATKHCGLPVAGPGIG